MRNALSGLAIFLTTLTLSCSAVSPPPGSGEGTTTTATGTPAPTGTPTSNPMCGGIANLPCPEGQICKDDPSDSCDPANGGRDCGGVCVPDSGGPPGGCDKPGRKYTGKNADICSRIRFFCEPGFKAFHDDNCGCGCEPEAAQEPSPPTKAGSACGKSTCGPTEFCCNPSCGICAPKGGACTQQVCD